MFNMMSQIQAENQHADALKRDENNLAREQMQIQM